MEIHYSVILGFLGQLQDRFATYHERNTVGDRVAAAAEVEGLSGVEPVYPADFRDYDGPAFNDLLDQHGLEASSVNVNIKAESKFHQGALTSIDPAIRAEAVQYIKNGMDLAAELGTNLVTVCPLADGHDYPFEIDYRRAWRWAVEGLGEAAAYRPDVKLSIEYKASEPRAKVIVPNAGVTLLLCEQIGLENVGITVDTGHALYTGESSAQTIALAANVGRLFLVHINDNYRNWDWDLVPGTVNYWDWLETLLVLEEVGYNDWLVTDVFPARSEPVRTLSMSYRAIAYGQKLLTRFGRDRLRRMIQQRDPLAIFDAWHTTFLDGERK